MAYFIDGLADELRKYGLKVEEVPGWKTRGYAGRGLAKVVGVMHHHTATARSAFSRSDSPTLNMCTYGRAGLAGPLCHILFARDGTCHIVAAGWANHAGTGKWTDIPWHRGNDHTIGIEYESSGVRPWDWTAEQLYWAPRLTKALRLIFGINNDMSHAEYSDAGKIDTAGWPGGWDGLRAQATAVRFGGLQSDTVTPIDKDWFDMATEKDLEVIIDRRIAALEKRLETNIPAKTLNLPVTLKGDTEGETTLRTKIAWLAHEQHRTHAALMAVDGRVVKLAAEHVAIGAAIKAVDDSPGITPERLEQIVAERVDAALADYPLTASPGL